VNGVRVRATTIADRAAVLTFVRDQWGDEVVVGHDEVMRPVDLSGYVAVVGDRIVALATFRVSGNAVELVTIDRVVPDQGLGTDLLSHVEREARNHGRRSVRRVTTNDNLHALGFYHRRGYRIVRVDPGAVDRARAMKPAIPLLGNDEIPIHDELVLEKRLGPASDKETP
jgi:GNAT superfamily N-acetyltransferase